jgi:hypothetical protein
MVKQIVFANVITGMCNASLQQMKLPEHCKKAIAHLLLNKCSLDPNNLVCIFPSIIYKQSFVSEICREGY